MEFFVNIVECFIIIVIMAKRCAQRGTERYSPGGVSLIFGATKMRLAKVSDPHTKSRFANQYYLLRGGTFLGGRYL